MDYLALKAELQNDPTGLGYAADWASGNDWSLADRLNAVSTGTLINRGMIDAHEILSATVPTEWTSLSAAEKQRYQTLTGAGQVNGLNANVRAAFNQMFGSTTATRAALVALLTRPGSRAEQLFGHAVSDRDIASARRV